MIAIVVVIIAAIAALLTWLVGWWAVLIVGIAAGAVWRRPALIALASALAWAALLAFDARSGRLGVLAHELGGVFPIPGWALLLFTLLFAAAAAWSTATIAAEIARRARPRTPGRSVEGETE